MHRVIVASLAALGSSIVLAAVASAADIAPAPAPLPVYTKAPVVAPLSWTGCYLGANAGGAFIHNKDSDPTAGGADLGSDSPSGFIGGGQVGCDYQAGPWVLGVQGMFDWTDLKGTHDMPGTLGLASVTNDQKYLATATGRIGYAMQPSVLLYAKGGAAWTRNDMSINFLGFPVDQATDNRVGWTGGAGLEYMFAPSWSVFFEYDYAGLGTKTVNFPIFGPVDDKQDIQSAVVGVNWRLRPW
jgi:outer membrane immunogenic protein